RGRHYSAADLAVLRSAVETIRLDLPGEPGHESEPAKGSESSAESSERELASTGTDGYTQANQELAPVAQWIEQRFPKPKVVRSSRAGGAIRFRRRSLGSSRCVWRRRSKHPNLVEGRYDEAPSPALC